MKKMKLKRNAALLLAALMAASFTACGGETSSGSQPGSETASGGSETVSEITGDRGGRLYLFRL